MKVEQHLFTTLSRDISESRQDPKNLWDAHNIRINNREENSGLTLTTEKGTTELLHIDGAIFIKACTIDKYIVVFGKKNGISYIWKVDTETHEYEELYKDTNYTLNLGDRIECFADYESDLVMKVYWIDEINSPRVINIVHPKEYYENRNTPFDFIPELRLEEKVSVTKLYNTGGLFPAGVIQYAFTYYNKYGQESNIFYTTPLYALSHKDRGANAESKVDNSFRITITDADHSFDYLRVYSIIRTSEEGTPLVKRVLDTPIKENQNVITIDDTGTIGDNVDPTKLLYIGGEQILAETMACKDMALFFGGITIKREEAAIDEGIKRNIENSQNTIDFSNRESVVLPITTSNDFYTYYNAADIAPFFKIGEHYRFGLQFQHKTGRWSEPVYIEDKIIDGNKPTFKNGNLIFAVGKYKISASEIGDIVNKGYKRVRPLVVLPTLQDRLILTQGVLCPTVFNTGARKENAPYAQSSWFCRPDSPNLELNGLSNNTDGSNSDVLKYGTYPRYQHLAGLQRNDWSGEIQGLDISTGETEKSFNYSKDKFFGVDRSILTMHSPDVEFDPDFTDELFQGWKMRIVGRSVITGAASDIDIQTSSPAGASDGGFKKMQFTATGINAGRSLIAAPLWQDYKYWYQDGKAEGLHFFGGYLFYMIYPWHKSGSLNNDKNRTDGSTKSAVLSKKKLSNLKFSEANVWLDTPVLYNDISDVGVFTSDQVVMEKFSDNGFTYYGNVDTLLDRGKYYLYTSSKINEKIVHINSESIKLIIGSLEEDGGSSEFSDPVRMKYKSTKHLFFSFNQAAFDINLLPTIGTSSESNTISVPWKTVTVGGGNVPEDAVTVNGFIESFDGEAYMLNPHLLVSEGDSAGDILLHDHYSDGRYTVYKTIRPWTSVYANVMSVKNDLDNQIIVKSEWTETLQDNNEVTQTFYSVAELVTGISQYYKEYKGNKVLVYEEAEQGIGYVIRNSRLDGTFTGDNSNITYVDNKINVPIDEYHNYSYLWLGEIYREESDILNAFGGKTDDAIKANNWIPAGEPVDINTNGDTTITFRYGDTRYQRYDCLKTYAFTNEDENSVIEIMSFLCETRINADGRYDRNRANSSNLVMSPINFNLFNPVYSQKNDYFTYKVLDEDYYKNSHYPTQITWTLEKQINSEVDNWTNITLANTYDLDGTKGSIRALRTFADNLFCFQDTGFSQIMYNSRVQIPVNDGVPIEIANSGKLEGKRYLSEHVGCSNKDSIIVTPTGLYFQGNPSKTIFLFNGQMSNISDSAGMSTWSRTRSLHSHYDNYYNDVYFTCEKDEESLCFSEKLNGFTSFMSYYNNTDMLNVNDAFYSIRKNGYIWKHFTGDYSNFYGKNVPFDITFISNQEGSVDKTFSNLEVRADFFKNNVLSDDFFDTIQVNNEYQDTGIVNLDKKKVLPSNIKQKFRLWGVEIPRDKVFRMDRIRNTWTKITLSKRAINSKGIFLKLHDLRVFYF